MKTEGIRQLFYKNGRMRGLAIVILAAVLLETIAAIQYYYTRSVLEHYLEKQVLIMLRASCMRMDGNLNAIVSQASNEIWHAQQHLDDPAYIEQMVTQLVKDGNGTVKGAAVAFRANYYKQKGKWYEPYAMWKDGTVSVEQIGSAAHDYFNMSFYKSCVNGETPHWSPPYIDEVGAETEVITYSLPVRDSLGNTVGVLGIDVSTNWTFESQREMQLYPSSFPMLLIPEGNHLIAHTDNGCSPELAKTITGMITDPEVKKEKKSEGKVTCFNFYDKQQGRSGRVYYVKKEHEPKWIMAKAVYDDEIFSRLKKMQRYLFLTALIGLLVLGVIIRLFSRNSRKLQDSLVQQQLTNQELQIANGIQRALLPLDEPSLKNVSEVAVEGRLIPAKAVGGDLYNVFVRGEKLFFCIGDVSGKGVPAALIMAVIQTLFHNVASEECNPVHIMERMNATACHNNRANMFVTLFIGVLDLKTGHLDYCNAGHECPILNGQPLKTVPNLPIGLLDDFSYQGQETTMAPGELLTLYTDGITEALNAKQQMFGRKHIKQLIADNNGLSPKEMADIIVNEVKQHAGNTEQSDDLTLLAICYKPQKEN